MHPRSAFGITATDGLDVARLGVTVESLGYEELWVNDTARGDGIGILGRVARATTTLRLAVGVVALSQQSPVAIAERLVRAEIPQSRITLGVGSGSSRSLALVRSGVEKLRQLIPGSPVAVAAVGPRMARLAGEVADAVVANWALPQRIGELRELVAAGASAAGRPTPRLVAYVRTAAGPGAADRLRAEMDRYASMGPHYARAFAEQRDGLIGVAVDSRDPRAVAEALVPYGAVADTVVVRGLPAVDTDRAWLDVITLAAP